MAGITQAGNHISIPSYHSRYSYWYPTGFHRIKDKFAAACYYTGKARGNYALCNIPSNSHAWRTVAQYNPGFVCGSRVNMNFTSVTQAVDRAPFSASLGARNGVSAAEYLFKVFSVDKVGKKDYYKNIMIAACKTHGMKPVCDHPSYCRNDKNAIYLGQNTHLARAGAPQDYSHYMPCGLNKLLPRWKNLCVYAGTSLSSGSKAACNRPDNTGSHDTLTPQQSNRAFICAKRVGPPSHKPVLKLDNHLQLKCPAGPSSPFAYSPPLHSSHARRDRVVPLPPCRLYGAATLRTPPLGPGRALTLPCGWNNAGRVLGDHHGHALRLERPHQAHPPGQQLEEG